MDIVTKHIVDNLDSFILDNDEPFENIYRAIQSHKKEKYKHLLLYINKLLNFCINKDNKELNGFHIHLEDDIDDNIKVIVAEFIVLKHFYSALKKYDLSGEKNLFIELKKEKLKSNLNKLANCPEGASGKNGGNKIFKNWQKEKIKSNSILNFYKSLNETSTLKPTTLINCQVRIQSRLMDLFEINPIAKDIKNIDDLNAYIILNTEAINSIKSIKVEGNFLLKLIENVVLFDCENSVKKFGEYSVEYLNNLNKNHGTGFNNVVIFTFGKINPSVNDLRSKIDLIRNRFKINSTSSYTILSSESTRLLNNKNGKSCDFEFFGQEKITFWDLFILETSIKDLYELRSIKMLNIYSLVFNDDIKHYLIDDILGDREKSLFLSYNTKQAILELNDEDRKSIKNSLSNTLDLINHEEWKEYVISQIESNSELILPEEVIKDKILKLKITTALRLTNTQKLKSWSDIVIQTDSPVTILSYRDQGKYPYHFYPNIIETRFPNSNQVSALFLKCFFSNIFEWAKYNISNEKLKYLNHPIREKYFCWNELKSKINSRRPLRTDTIQWDLESDYSYSENRETIKIKFKDVKKSKLYSASDLFITRLNNTSIFRVEKLSELSNLDMNEESLSIQNLDVIQEELNIYEKIIDFNQSEEELKIIRTQFNIPESDSRRLWKILLKAKAESKGEIEFYNELRLYLNTKSQNIVSFFHFKNSWINPNSDSLTPLNKKVFIAICDYLEIPKTYFIIMQRIKNSSKQATTQSTRQMNNLLKDLFNDGCFDDIKKAGNILQKKIDTYKNKHPLDEIGIDENYLLNNLVALVELIHPEIKLQVVESIEKIEQ